MKDFKEMVAEADAVKGKPPKKFGKKVDIVQRKKMARRMKKLAKSPAFQAKKKRTLRKFRNAAQLTKSARKKTINLFRKKFYPNYDSMAIGQKVKIDQMVMQKYGARIDKLTNKAVMKLRKDEPARVKAAKLAGTKAEK
mgnify:FL=1